MDETTTNTNGAEPQATRQRVVTRVREAREGALHAIWDTPGWVWAVVAGVLLLMVGILAASRYRSSRATQEH